MQARVLPRRLSFAFVFALVSSICAAAGTSMATEADAPISASAPSMSQGEGTASPTAPLAASPTFTPTTTHTISLTTTHATTSPTTAEFGLCVSAVRNVPASALPHMVDACGKVNSGYLEGNVYSLGDFDQCSHLEGEGIVYALQTVIVTGVPAFEALMQAGAVPALALCMPKACVSPEGGTIFLESLVSLLRGMDSPKENLRADALAENLRVPGVVFYGAPEIVEYSASMDWRAIATVLLLGFLLIASLVGAVISLEGVPGCFSLRCRASPPVKWVEYLRCFSLTENLWCLCDTTQRFSQTSSLEGARVLSMQWVVIGHLYLLWEYNVSNLAHLQGEMGRWTLLVIENATVSVDSFFTISGFLLAMVTMRKLRSKPIVSPLRRVRQFGMFILHRWLRLTPGLALVMLVAARLVPYVSDGPRWEPFMGGHECDKYWWTNILYINNFIPKNLKDECIAQSWYLANDFQFFAITLPLLMSFRDFAPFRNKLWLRCSVIMVLIVVSIICQIVLVDVYDIGITTNTAKGSRMANYLYVQPQYRYATYGIGVITGLLMDHWNQSETAKESTVAAEEGEYLLLEDAVGGGGDSPTKSDCRLKCLLTPRTFKWQVAFFVSLAVMIFCVFCVYEPYNGHEFNHVEKVLYNSFNRTLWSTAFAVILVGCMTGGLPLINKLLSLPIYIPLSKLSYGCYLIHLTLISAWFYQDRTVGDFLDQDVVYKYAAILSLAYLLSATLFVLVDLPVAKLETKLLGRE